MVWNGYRWEVTIFLRGEMLLENEEIENVFIPSNGEIKIRGNDSDVLFIEYERVVLEAPIDKNYRVCISEKELCINMANDMEE